jgi:hypothetical protein
VQAALENQLGAGIHKGLQNLSGVLGSDTGHRGGDAERGGRQAPLTEGLDELLLLEEDERLPSAIQHLPMTNNIHEVRNIAVRPHVYGGLQTYQRVLELHAHQRTVDEGQHGRLVLQPAAADHL